MYKVLRSYSKKAERKHELTRSSDQHHATNGGSHNAFALTATDDARSGQVVPIDSRRIETMNSAWTGAQAFSESSSYEAREHFERKVQRVKKTRGERDSNRKSKKSKVSSVRNLQICMHHLHIFFACIIAHKLCILYDCGKRFGQVVFHKSCCENLSGISHSFLLSDLLLLHQQIQNIVDFA